MTINFKNLALGLVLLSLSSCAQHCCEDDNKVQCSKTAAKYFKHELAHTINPGGLKTVIKENKNKYTIVDVRSEEAYKAGHIPGAINMPYNKYENFEGSEKHFAELRKDGYNYVYCYELLCNLSQKAAQKFASVGYPVKEIKGGFKSWQEHKYLIEKK